MAEEKILLEIKNLKKQFGNEIVLKDISLKVREGEVVSIIGPSGSGKSTLLRCATMLENPDGGEISYEGEKACFEEEDKDGKMRCIMANKKEKKEIRKKFGLVFQNFQLFPHYSVMKNLTDLLEQLGLSGKEEAYPYQLSGGQQQRVSIARALALNPKVLFFDEPTSALDPELTQEVLKVILQLAKQKMTMIIVTHEMQFAKEVSDRIVFMEHGVVVEEGTPEELFTTDNERVKEFIGKMENFVISDD